MFNCQSCKKTTAPGERATRIVVATTSVRHPAREDAHRFRQGGVVVTRDDPGGTGTQITAEIDVCSRCALLS